MGVKLSRYRNTGYFVRAFTSQGEKQYTWSGAKGNKVDTKEVPNEVYDYLTMNSLCFDKGELVIAEDNEDAEDLKQSIDDVEAYDHNTHTKEEIEKILKGNTNKMKKELESVTSESEKQFVISIAQEMAEDMTKGKLDFLAEWMGTDADILFD
ncbi:hypothetical protein [Halobacillus litoralis]|uniref:hypothetical protein n=1 Tax=Halobacillus litoralis TaxID=45668 RepID=UPI001CD3AF50|nr:hypothetical protein [Halobacillus litoralis]MCA1021641.1 hypothetical protein [Halobacillus litoralis]